MSTQPYATTTIDLEQTDDGHWTATQRDVELVGYGDDPGKAVEHYGAIVSETVYASD